LKIICKRCGGLVNEEDAIKMSQFDYECEVGQRLDINPFSVSTADYMHKQMVTICEECYNRPKW
jgi:hypothetical protein